MEEQIEFNPKEWAREFFNIEVTPTQEKLLIDILKDKKKRMVILAMTRYGKSMMVSMAVLMYAMYNPGKRIILVSPTYKQARILMEYIAGYIVASEVVAGYVDLDATGISRLKKEVTKERITFKNGSEIRILSAEGKGERLMGFGADMIVEDESALISDEVYRMRIMRMLGDNPDEAVLVEIGNPFPGNHFEDNYKNMGWDTYKIDYHLAKTEGRITQKFIDEQKAILTPMEFTILYEAEFPEEAEDALIKWDWINSAIERKFEDIQVKNKYLGCDIAEAGMDWTVVTSILETTDGKWIVTNIKRWHKADTMITTGQIMDINTQFKANKIKVDAIGVGKGVYDRLREMRIPALPIKVGMSPTREPERFLNQKAQFYWNLRTLFEEGRISIPNDSNLIKELRQMRYELTSAAKIRIVDPEEKSPDYADSLMIACAEGHVVRIIM
jgi:hypothetical protein